jgi:hypothetical protein
MGGLYHKFKYTNCYIDNPGSKDKVTYYNYYNKDLFGLIGSLSVNFVDNKKIESGCRFDVLTSFTDGYFNIDSMQAGIYLGMKF